MKPLPGQLPLALVTVAQESPPQLSWEITISAETTRPTYATRSAEPRPVLALHQATAPTVGTLSVSDGTDGTQ